MAASGEHKGASTGLDSLNTIESLEEVELSKLVPQGEFPTSSRIEGVVTVIWPYFSGRGPTGQGSLAFHLDERENFRCANPGLVRVQLKGRAAREFHQEGLINGFKVRIGLGEATWSEVSTAWSALHFQPQNEKRRVAGELVFTDKVFATIQPPDDESHPKLIDTRELSPETPSPLPQAQEPLPSPPPSATPLPLPKRQLLHDDARPSPAKFRTPRLSTEAALFDFFHDTPIRGEGQRVFSGVRKWIVEGRTPPEEATQAAPVTPTPVQRSPTPTVAEPVTKIMQSAPELVESLPAPLKLPTGLIEPTTAMEPIAKVIESSLELVELPPVPLEPPPAPTEPEPATVEPELAAVEPEPESWEPEPAPMESEFQAVGSPSPVVEPLSRVAEQPPGFRGPVPISQSPGSAEAVPSYSAAVEHGPSPESMQHAPSSPMQIDEQIPSSGGAQQVRDSLPYPSKEPTQKLAQRLESPVEVESEPESRPGWPAVEYPELPSISESLEPIPSEPPLPTYDDRTLPSEKESDDESEESESESEDESEEEFEESEEETEEELIEGEEENEERVGLLDEKSESKQSEVSIERSSLPPVFEGQFEGTERPSPAPLDEGQPGATAQLPVLPSPRAPPSSPQPVSQTTTQIVDLCSDGSESEADVESEKTLVDADKHAQPETHEDTQGLEQRWQELHKHPQGDIHGRTPSPEHPATEALQRSPSLPPDLGMAEDAVAVASQMELDHDINSMPEVTHSDGTSIIERAEVIGKRERRVIPDSVSGSFESKLSSEVSVHEVTEEESQDILRPQDEKLHAIEEDNIMHAEQLPHPTGPEPAGGRSEDLAPFLSTFESTQTTRLQPLDTDDEAVPGGTQFTTVTEYDDFDLPQMALYSDEKDRQVTPTSKHSASLSPAPGSPIGLKTSMGYYTPLAFLPAHLNAHDTIDVLTVVSRGTDTPKRADKGPRDYFTSFSVVDAFANQPVPVKVFRPYKAALPVASEGDVVLLRDVKVRSRRRVCVIDSTEEASWCVWRYGMVGEKGARPPEEMNGPPVELGMEERAEAQKLREWWLEKGMRKWRTEG